MVDTAEVGKYGTIRLLKRRDPTVAVTSYPIDEEEVTFGRGPSCSVRLYYQCVSPLHCKIFFEERKAFLQVFGTNGVVVDGCPVAPNPSTSGNGNPTTVPLVNGSSFEIYNKLFRFDYPPKELRAVLNSPAMKRRKSLRISMIESAQVFSPRPSQNPRENLRILQSPLKPFSSTSAYSGEEEEVIKLVDGNHPLVLEEERDLVIMEDMPTAAPPTTVASSAMSAQQLRTPRRRSAPSLHRAVLIRSAQRAAYMQEIQGQRLIQPTNLTKQFEEVEPDEDDAMEEDEVEEAVSSDLLASDESEEDIASGDVLTEEFLNDHNESTEEIEADGEQDITEAQDAYDDAEQDARAPSPVQQYSTPLQVTRLLGAFMTPQPRSLFQKPDNSEEAEKTKPQRPPPGSRLSLAPGLGGGTLVPRTIEDSSKPGEAKRGSPTKSKPTITQEERKAILDRRKSAFTVPDSDFSHVPGLGERRTSALPPPVAPTSPFKSISEEIDGGQDTRSVLKKMEESLAAMRRKSLLVGMGRGLPVSQAKQPHGFSLLAPSLSSAKTRTENIGAFKADITLGFEQTIPEETGSRPRKDEEEKEGRHENGDVDLDHKHHQIPPATPRMDGLRDLFRDTTAKTGLATPAFTGVRELFRTSEKTNQLHTPKMDGMRHMFKEKIVPMTPAYEGIEEMLQIENDEDDDHNDENGHADDTVETNKPQKTSQLTIRAPKTGTRRQITRITEESPNMADDEITPEASTGPQPKGKRGVRNVEIPEGTPEAAVVHRSGRIKRAVGVGSNVEPVAKMKANTTRMRSATKNSEASAPSEVEQLTKLPARRGRTLRTAQASSANDSEAVASDPVAKTKSKSQTRKATIPATVTDSEHAYDEQTVPATVKPSRRGANKLPEDDSSALQAPRRLTRMRSRSVDQEGDAQEDPLDTIERKSPTKTKRGVRAQAKLEVETIYEEEVAPQPLRKKTTSRVRKTNLNLEDSHDEIWAAKSRNVAGNKTMKKPILSITDESERKEDKENSPSHSPTSTASSVEEMPTKVAKPRATAKTRATRAAAKTRSEEMPIPATRTTRSRTRK